MNALGLYAVVPALAATALAAAALATLAVRAAGAVRPGL